MLAASSKKNTPLAAALPYSRVASTKRAFLVRAARSAAMYTERILGGQGLFQVAFIFAWGGTHAEILEKPERPLRCPYLPTYLPTLLTVHYESVPRLISHGSNPRYSARPWASKLPYMLVHVPHTYVDNSGTTLHRFTPGWPAARSPNRHLLHSGKCY